jgi:hypothetical protein
MKKNTNIIYENQCLRNTNYYLLCTIYNLEKQKIVNFNEFIKKTEERLLDNSIENEFQKEEYSNVNSNKNDNDNGYSDSNVNMDSANGDNDSNVNFDNDNNANVDSDNGDNTTNDMNIELMNELEEKKTQYNLLSSELKNIKIEMEVQKEFSEHKILNLELAKNLLEQELLDKREKYKQEEIDKSLVLEIEKDQHQYQEEELIKK